MVTIDCSPCQFYLLRNMLGRHGNKDILTAEHTVYPLKHIRLCIYILLCIQLVLDNLEQDHACFGRLMDSQTCTECTLGKAFHHRYLWCCPNMGFLWYEVEWLWYYPCHWPRLLLPWWLEWLYTPNEHFYKCY